MNAWILPVVALLFLGSAVRRYRGDSRALAAGIAAGCAGTLGAALALPDINLHIPLWLILALGGVAIVVAVGGSIYAETRIKRVRL